MALPLTIDKLDDVAEAFREHYVERNGKFALDTDADPRLTTARREAGEERKKRQALEQEMTSLKQQIEELGKRRQRDDDDQETSTQRLNRLRTELEQAKRESEDTRRQKELEALQLKTELTQERIGNRIRSAANGKLLTGAVEDAVLFGMRVWKQDEAGKIAAFDDAGERLLGKNGEDLTIEEWLDQRRTDRGHWFAQQGSGNQGGGAGHQGSGNGAARARPKQRSQMTPQEKAAAIGDMGMEAYLALPN